jgi:probable rRNA maturation factor
MQNINIDIQIASDHPAIPSQENLIEWVLAALETTDAEITIRIVDEAESSQLNEHFRNKLGPTNVLSFPFKPKFDQALHGDIVICAPIANKEAQEQNKISKNHWAHLTIHGILHLQGYDHIKKSDAKKMAAKEVALLAGFGMPNPYE